MKNLGITQTYNIFYLKCHLLIKIERVVLSHHGFIEKKK